LLPYLTIISVSCEDTEENYESAVLWESKLMLSVIRHSNYMWETLPRFGRSDDSVLGALDLWTSSSLSD
jgi:hypothetical protein